MNFKQGGRFDGFLLVNNLKKARAISAPSILNFAATNYGLNACLGTRQLLERRKIISEDNNSSEKLILGKYIYKSYQEVNELVKKFSYGLKPYLNHNVHNQYQPHIALFGETRTEWYVATLGCLRRRAVVVILPINLPNKHVINSLTETKVQIIITSDGPLLSRLINEIFPVCPLINYVIVIEDPLKKTEPLIFQRKIFKNIFIIPYRDLIFTHDENENNNFPDNIDNIEANEENNVAFIMYTSGSTMDQPKGVAFTHANIFSAVSAFCIRVDYRLLGHLYLAYLPLAYVMELIIELAFIAMDITIAYSSPSTLTDMSPQIMKGCCGDFIEAQPTCVYFEPYILEHLINDMIYLQKNLSYSLKFWDYTLKHKQKSKWKWTAPILDKLILSQIRQQIFGNQLMTVFIGGALVSSDIYHKARTLLNCSILVCYGTTETTACISTMQRTEINVLHCGDPNFAVKLSLTDWVEGGYKSTDKPYPRGEIVVGGPMVAHGYLKNNEEQYDDSFFLTESGIWSFRTGDIGEIDNKSGVLRLIDHKSNFKQLTSGEYVSLGEIECQIRTHPLVDNICVYIYPGTSSVLALIVPSSHIILKMGSHFKIPSSDPRVLCCNSRIVKTFLAKIRAYGQKHGWRRDTLPSAIYLCPFPWTPESGLLTITYKIKRPTIIKHFQYIFNALYMTLLEN
ncbi:Long chain acyl-CoA synthetase 9, chloroplastic [Astathelohania contejeani]|uniref:Long chain acyl-CoA synthetase 9, chloroplastic n=1 Tax=Astathelohania contejeani TaxID=164912 RepID=A0ABQ7HX06_9MICR|nr:Long chain acyl-CoA synthetase 9, chloroplastic [Thelohania contejeani]